MKQQQVEEIIAKEQGQKCTEVTQRLKKENDSYSRFEKGNILTQTESAKKIKAAYDKLKSKEEFKIKSFESLELRYVLQAITHLSEEELDLDYVLGILKNIYDHHFNSNSVTKTFIRQAICHVDLVVFGKKYFEAND